MAAGVGLLSGIAGAGLAVAAQAPEGVRGMMAGVAMCLGAILTWRAFGGTLQDVRDLWR